MREILFRGKQLKSGIWIVGFYVKRYNETAEYEDLAQNYIFDGDFYRIIDPETLGQFTGLCDKNGKKVFEGDIVKEDLDGAIAVVAFGDYASPGDVDFTHNIGFYLRWEEKYRKRLRKDLGFFCINGSFEVIGNIHDNPELIEHLEGSI